MTMLKKQPSITLIPRSFNDAKKINMIEKSLSFPVKLKGLPSSTMTILDRMAHHKVPGVSIALIENGEIAWAKSWGVCDVDGKEPVTTDTLFQAASMSKPVAAFAAMRMVGKGELSLTSSINDHLTSWQLPENEFTKKEAVTLERLLSHTAGTTVHGFLGYADHESQPKAVEVLKGSDLANSDPVVVDLMPGSQWRYSGGGYTVIQQAMEDTSETDFAELMEQLVLQPAGMSSSTFEQPLPKSLRYKATSGHLANGQVMPQKFNSYAELAAAGLWCTPIDLAKLSLAVMRCWHGEQDALLSPALTKKYLTKQKSGSEGPWGLGFGLYEDKGEIIGFQHSGSNINFIGKTVGFLDGRGAVVMMNGEGGGLLGEILTAIATVYDWPAHQVMHKDWSILGEGDQAKYVGVYDSTETSGELTHSVRPAKDGIIVSSPFFPESMFYLEKHENNQAHFVAANGADFYFTEDDNHQAVLNVAGFALVKI